MRPAHIKACVATVFVTVALGWLLLLPLGAPNLLVRWSFDLLQLAERPLSFTNIVVVHMDEQALQDYGQTSITSWSRKIHAQLLDRLTRDEPRAVVFDVEMTMAGNRDDDTALAQAMQRNQRVVLAGSFVPISGLQRAYTIQPPVFETNTARWGIAKLLLDSDRVARTYLEGNDETPSLVWAAATVADAPITRDPARRLAEQRWLNYYGSPRPFALHSMTYRSAETAPPGFFRDKTVFIGGQPETLLPGERPDVHGTPFTAWNREFVPGVEIWAVAYANLISEQWWRRLGPLSEFALLALTGLLAALAASIGSDHPTRRLLAISGLALLLVILSVAGTQFLRTWFPWAIAVFAQLPVALFAMAFLEGRDRKRAEAMADRARLTALTEVTADDHLKATEVPAGRPEIPDQTLIRCIGEGAYGQVWIARNTIGLHHAIKVIYRSRFGTAAPFERALRGIQKFMPISRSHEGFVHLLHVGRNDRAEFFFYVMEAGDDIEAGQRIQPETYTPRTLAGDLRIRGPLSPRECLELMLALTDAVERLHQHQLVHRDIKPDNILYVGGRPKLADIDLVTTLAGPGEVSRIGTEGYLAPEGPGTAAADVFSLGRVFYVALTGKPPAQCPELPTQVTALPDSALHFELNQVICKACEFATERRYSSAAALRADLQRIVTRLNTT